MATVAIARAVEGTAPQKCALGGCSEMGRPERSLEDFSILVIDQGNKTELLGMLAGTKSRVAVADTLEEAVGRHGSDLSTRFSLMLAGVPDSQTCVGSVNTLVRSLAVHDVPVVVMSANKDIMNSCLEAGASDFVAKPLGEGGLECLQKHAWIRGGRATGLKEALNAAPRFMPSQLEEGSAVSESEDGCTEALGAEHPLLGGRAQGPAGHQPPSYKAQRSLSRDSSSSEQSGGLPGPSNTYAILQATYQRCGGGDAPAVTSLRRTDGASAFRSFCADGAAGSPRPSSSSPSASDASCSRAVNHPNAALIAQAVASDAAAMEFYNCTLAALGMQLPAGAREASKGAEASPSLSEDVVVKTEEGRAGVVVDSADSARGGDDKEGRKILSALDAKERRRIAVEKFRKKRKERNFDKKVRYESRKRLADQRPRVRGQFVKIADQAVAADAKEK